MKLTQKIAAAARLTRIRLLSRPAPALAARLAFRFFCTPLTRKIAPLTPLFQSAEPVSFIFQKNKITGYRWNKGGRRKILVAHGFESTATNFEMLVSMLAANGCEVLAFDAPANGRSEGKQINAITYRDFIKHIFSVWGPFDGAIAHSLGGLAMSMALAELPHGEGFRLVLIGPATQTSTVVRLFLQHTRLDNEKMKHAFNHVILQAGGFDVDWFSIPRALPAIRAGILWVHDEEDAVTPYSDVRPLQQQWPGINFLITKGLGHSKIYRDAEVGKTIASYLC
ncbi:MAG TPA: alpha/beta fold hydrolase [Chitinophagaceae bacterium]|nr:alpha/beta fold hydrolase [Chitinophagaceae bacterium]